VADVVIVRGGPGIVSTKGDLQHPLWQNLQHSRRVHDRSIKSHLGRTSLLPSAVDGRLAVDGLHPALPEPGVTGSSEDTLAPSAPTELNSTPDAQPPVSSLVSPGLPFSIHQ
jgi:hypothetical protein